MKIPWLCFFFEGPLKTESLGTTRFFFVNGREMKRCGRHNGSCRIFLIFGQKFFLGLGGGFNFSLFSTRPFLGKRANLTCAYFSDFGWGKHGNSEFWGIREMGKVRKLDDKKKGIKIKSLDKADKAHWW